MRNISDLIGTPDYYELKIPYAIFPKSEYLKFETRIIKNDKTHPLAILNHHKQMSIYKQVLLLARKLHYHHF